jgi:hypothetical protein
MVPIAWEEFTPVGQCAFLTQLTKENSLLRVSHFDSHAASSSLASNVSEQMTDA